MSNRNESFGRLLKGAINSIAAYEGKTAPAIEDELGAQMGVAGTAIQRYKAGHLPPEPRAIQILAEAAVRRGFLSRAWLQRFLHAARYPQPDALIAQLADALGLPGAPGSVAALPTGTLAFLFTDIVGSTVLWERQPQAMEPALARHDALLRQAIDADGGQVVRTAGDAFHAVFTTVAAALDAALAIQRSLAAEPWGPIGAIQVRVAVHVGTAQLRDGDYFGPPLNRVARLLDAGHGGQVLLSNAAQELVRDALPKGTELRDLGEHRLKDLARPERIFQVVAPDLPAEFSPLRSLDRYTHNLPAQPTPLIGREAEVAVVCDLLRRNNTRVLTLTGPGGIGKTRLALQAAAELLDDFRDGVFFVALAPIREVQFVVTVVAQALGVKEASDRPLVDLLKAYLREKQTLLLLDNFEHLAPAALLIADLLAAAPDLKVLLTSREVLHIYGEHEYAVPPLSMPDMRRLPPLERLTQYEAVQLFIERAQAVRPDFAITAENAPAVAEICARLDGLPLAIELAAARSKLFPPRALLARLDKRLALLVGGPRDLPARQQTLRGAITWSYDLLDAAEQALFARLGVFAGGCTLKAAEAVLSDDGRSETEMTIFIPSDAVLDGLASLVDKSLLEQVEGVGDESRLVMLETIREYALEQLAAHDENETLRQRHAEYYLTLAEAAELELEGPRQLVWLQRLELEHDNVRAALGGALERGNAALALRLAGALEWFWIMRGYLSEGRRWLEALLALPASSTVAATVRAKALSTSGYLAHLQGDQAMARPLLPESLTLFREVGDKRGIVVSLVKLGWITLYDRNLGEARALFEEGAAICREVNDKGRLAAALFGLGATVMREDIAAARPILEQSVALLREVGNKGWLISSLNQLGMVAWLEGDYAQAGRLFEEGLALCRELQERYHIPFLLNSLGDVARYLGDHRRAAALYEEALALAQQIGDKSQIAMALMGLAGLAGAAGRPERAARLLSAAEAFLVSSGLTVSVWPTSAGDDLERTADAARAQLGEEAFAAAWAEGCAMPLNQAVDEALAFIDGLGQDRRER